MKVSTTDFTVDEHAYARALVRAYFKRNAWSYTPFALVAIAGVVLRTPALVLLGLGVGGAIALYRVWWFRRYTRDPENAPFFEPRRYTFTDEMLEVVAFDGTEMRQPLGSLIRAERDDDHWKLYVSKGQFHYLPFSAFASEADNERLEAILRAQGLA